MISRLGVGTRLSSSKGQDVIKLKEQGFSLRIARIEQEGPVKEVTFRVVDKAGKPVDEGELTLTQEAQGCRIRSL